MLAQRYATAFANPQQWLQRQEPQLDAIGAIELATAIATEAAVLVTDHPALAQTGQHPVLSALRL